MYVHKEWNYVIFLDFHFCVVNVTRVYRGVEPGLMVTRNYPALKEFLYGQRLQLSPHTFHSDLVERYTLSFLIRMFNDPCTVFLCSWSNFPKDNEFRSF